MPLYTYKCLQCEEVQDIRQSMSDPVLTICPLCNGQLEKQLTVPMHMSFGITTIGSISDRNGDRMPDDQKHTLTKESVTKLSPKDKLSRKLQKATPEQRKNYIINGTI